jgi:hypothetical protein
MVIFVFLFVCVQLLTLCIPTAYANTETSTSWKDEAKTNSNVVGNGWRCTMTSSDFGLFYYKVNSQNDGTEKAYVPDEKGDWYYYPKYFDGLTNESVLGAITVYAAGDFLCTSAFSIACAAQGVHPTMSIAAIGTHIFSVLNLKDAGGKQNIISIGTDVYNTLAVVGLLLVILYFIIDLLDEMQADHFTVDHLIKKLITMAVAILVISQGAEIFEIIIRLCESIMNDVEDAFRGAAVNNVSSLQAAYEHMIYSDGFFAFVEAMGYALGLILDNIVAYILSYVALLFAYLTAFSRFLEIMIRFAMAPIGLAPLVSGGAKGSGMRYLKKFASVCIQGAVCVAALASATVLSSMLTGLSAVIGQVLIPLTLIGFMSKTQGIADDIVGV